MLGLAKLLDVSRFASGHELLKGRPTSMQTESDLSAQEAIAQDMV